MLPCARHPPIGGAHSAPVGRLQVYCRGARVRAVLATKYRSQFGDARNTTVILSADVAGSRGNTCSVDCRGHGFQQPLGAVVRARADPVRAGRSAVPTGANGGDSPAWSRTAPAYEPPERLERPPRGGALRRAALPLQLQLPRRRLPPRGAGRGGGPARPRGARPHRPRRLLRRGPLRRGGPRPRPAHRLRRRAHPRPIARPLRPPAGRRADPAAGPAGHHLLVLARDPVGYARLARAISRSQMAGEKGAPRLTLDELAELAGAPLDGAATGWCSPAAARGRCRPRWWPTARPPPPAALAELVERFGRDTVAVELWDHGDPLDSARNDALADLAVRAGVDLVATNNVHYATRRAGRWPPRWPRCGPGAASTRSTAGSRPGPAPTCARGPSRPAASPATRAWSSGPPSSASSAPSTCTWSPRTCRRSRAPTATTRWATSGGWWPRGRPGPSATARPTVSGCPAPTRRSTTSSTSSSSSASPATSSSSGTSSVLPEQRHLLPGPGLGRQLGGLLRPRHHQRRRGRPRPAVRALPLPRARRPARHRPRHRERPARGGHPVRLRPHGRDYAAQVANVITYRAKSAVRDMAKALGSAPGQQDAWSKQVDRWGPVAATAGQDDITIPAAGARAGRAGGALPPPPRHPLGRHGHLRPAGRRGVPGRVGPHGGPHRPAVGQGRLRRGRPGEVRPARPRHALGAALRGRPHPRAPRRRARPGRARQHRPGGLRHALPGRLGRRVPGRVPGPDGHAAPARAPHLLRPGGRGGAHPPRPDPGRLGAPLHPPPQRPGAGHLPAPAARAGAWPRRSACRCSRSSSCRWPSTSPGSRPARPTSCARPWARSGHGSGWSGSGPGSTRAWPSGASPARSPTRSGRSSPPSPTTASPRATR